MWYNAESEVAGAGRARAEAGQWFRLHGPGKGASVSDAGIVRVAVAVLDKDVRRSMYEQPLLSQDKFKGKLHTLCPDTWCSSAFLWRSSVTKCVHGLVRL